MAHIGAIIVALVAFSVDIEGSTVNNRVEGLFDNFGDDFNVPPDLIDDTDAHNTNGVALDISGHGVKIFDLDVNFLKLFDVGFIDCDNMALSTTVPDNAALPVVTSDSVAAVASRCMILPFVAPDTTQTSYHMSYGIVDKTKEETLYKLQQITGRVNRAKNQFKTTWQADYGVIVTWRMTGGAGTNIFQTVLAVGDNSDGNRETYVMFLYEDMPLAGNGVQGQINGKYTAGSEKFARICSDAASTAVASPEILTANSNYKCGNPGEFVFGTNDDPTLSCADPATACTELHAGCNRTSVPQDSCTESFYCTVDPDVEDNVELTVTVKWYQWGRLQALNYDKYNTNEEQELVEYIRPGDSDDSCGTDLPDPGTSDSSGNFSLSVPNIAFVQICGATVDPAAKSVAACFKIYDNDKDDSKAKNRVIDKYGDLIFCGTCYFEDLPLEIQADGTFNDFSPPTLMPPRERKLFLSTIDRGDADGFHELTTTLAGRYFWLLLTYEPGTPFNVWTEPFGATAMDCYVSNNAAFTHNPASWERSELFIKNGCHVDKEFLEAIYLTKSFEADVDHTEDPPVGDPYYSFAGPIIAAKWMNQAKIFFKCTVVFCIKPDEMGLCVDPCPSDKKRKKRRSIEDGDNLEVVYTQIEILSEEPEAEKQTCRTTLTTTIVTETVLLALLLVMVLLCVCLALKLSPLRKKRASLKKIPSY